MRIKLYPFLVMIFALFALIFAFFSQFDIQISALFFSGKFAMEQSAFWQVVRKLGMVPSYLCGFLALTSLTIVMFKVNMRHLSVKVSLFWLSTLALAPLLIVNGLFKEFWHRARPIQIHEFGGHFTFTPWNKIGNATECISNCSFVSGEASGAFWLLAIPMVLPKRYKALGYAVVLIYASFISALRLMMGGHFITDIAFAAFITYSILIILYALIFNGTEPNVE